MEDSPIDEVRRQHVFIQTWLSGGGVDEDGWRHFEQSLGEGFTMVTPAGIVVGRDELLGGFRAASGAMPNVTIEIRNATLLHTVAEFAVVRYEEWQLHSTLSNQRVSTAAFVSSPESPLGWAWLSLHETSLPGVSA